MLVLSFFIFLSFLVIGFIFSKVKIKVRQLEFEMIGKNNIKNKYEINLALYLFGILKIFGITFNDNNLKFIGKKIEYKKIKRYKIYNRIYSKIYNNIYSNIIKKDVKEMNGKLILKSIKDLNPKFEKIILYVDFGTESTLITSFFTFIIATFVSMIIKSGVTKYNSKKHRFIITPKYEDRNMIKVKFDTVITFKFLNIIKITKNYKYNIKQKKIIKLTKQKKHLPGFVQSQS